MSKSKLTDNQRQIDKFYESIRTANFEAVQEFYGDWMDLNQRGANIDPDLFPRIDVEYVDNYDPSKQIPNTPLYQASSVNNFHDHGEFLSRKKIIEFLVLKGADVNLPSRSNATPFHIAINANSLGLAEFLKDLGADINIANKYGCTALDTVNEFSCLASQSAHLLEWGAKTGEEIKQEKLEAERAKQQKGVVVREVNPLVNIDEQKEKEAANAI